MNLIASYRTLEEFFMYNFLLFRWSRNWNTESVGTFNCIFSCCWPWRALRTCRWASLGLATSPSRSVPWWKHTGLCMYCCNHCF